MIPKLTRIRVDRSEVIDPTQIEKPLLAFESFFDADLQRTGPDHYVLADLYSPLSFVEKPITSGTEIFSWLLSEGILEKCLNLQDALAISEQASKDEFLEFVPENFLPCWKSVVLNKYGNELVPVVRAKGDSLVVYWHWVFNWKFPSPAVYL